MFFSVLGRDLLLVEIDECDLNEHGLTISDCSQGTDQFKLCIESIIAEQSLVNFNNGEPKHVVTHIINNSIFCLVTPVTIEDASLLKVRLILKLIEHSVIKRLNVDFGIGLTDGYDPFQAKDVFLCVSAFSDLLDLAIRVNQLYTSLPKTNLYKLEGVYILHILNDNSYGYSIKYMGDLFAVLEEYGLYVFGTKAVFIEHGKYLIEGNALQLLASLG